MPAVAGRFFLYYLGFPQYIELFGISISVFVLMMCICMAMAVFIICCGGTLSIVITDAVQGMICLPLIVIFSFFLLWMKGFLLHVQAEVRAHIRTEWPMVWELNWLV